MATITLTPNLKLRVSSDLTADAKLNLQRIDSLGSLYQVDTNQVARVRSQTDIRIQPQDPDIGGSGSGGTVQVGSSDQPADLFQVYATSVSISGGLAFGDQATGGNKNLNIGYKSDINGAVDTTADRNLLFDLDGADRNVVLGGNLTIDNNLTFSMSGTTSLTLPTTGTLASDSNTLTLTNKTISASNNTISEITNTSIAVAAAIAGTKIDPDFGAQQVQSTAGFSSSVGVPFKLPSSDGASGEAIVTDGFGQLSFAATATTFLLEDYIRIGNASNEQTAVNTTTLGDIQANVTTGLTIKAGAIVDADVNASAAINISKLAGTASRALQTSGTGVVEVSSVTSTELGYLSGVTSAIQTQLNAKQPLDNDLTAVAGLTGTGLIARTGDGSAVLRSIAVGSAKLTIANADGFLGNPTLDLGTVSTDDLTEGTNLFFTNERAQDAVGTILIDSASVDFTYDDGLNQITAAVLPAGVDHDSLSGFVANEHIDHSAVTLTAGAGLSGGGDITASRSFDVAINPEALTTYDAADEILVADSSDTFNIKKITLGLIDHDSLTNFVANEHIDHSTVSITAGIGLTGGGDITATRTLDLDIAGLTDIAYDSADQIAVADFSDSNNVRKISLSEINHDSLTNFVVNEHLDHSSIQVIAGVGLSGGGTITTNRTIDLDIAGLNPVAADAADTIVILDNSDFDTTKKATISSINHDQLTGFVADEHVAHSGVSVVAGGDDGLLASNNDLTSNLGLAVDITGTTAETSIVGADEVLLYDSSAAALRKATLTNVFAGLALQTFKDNWTQIDGSTVIITHNLNTLDVRVEIYDTADGATIVPDSVVRNTVNQVTITGANLPATFDFRVLISEV